MTSSFSVYQVCLLLFITISGVIWSVVFSQPLVIGFLPGYLVLFILSLKKNMQIRRVLSISLEGILKTRIVVLVLLLVSLLLPTWFLAGTIEQMVQIALYVINAHHFFVLSFLVAMVFSMLLGTTVGTLSAIGVPIIGTAIVLHLPISVVAGALVSGAFVGDRTSPFSSAHQLLSHTLEVPVKRQWKAMLGTTMLAITGCFCFYGIFDFFISSQTDIVPRHLAWRELSLLKFMPPLVLIGFVVGRIPIIYSFLASILSAAAISLWNGTFFSKLIHAVWYGIDGLGGGFSHMYQLLLFLVVAGAYNGLLEELQVIQPYLDKWLETSHSLFSDTWKALISSFIITVIAANQTLPIILTGRSFLPHWSNRYGKEELVRVMGDTTMLFPGVVPWSVLAIMCSTIVGIPLLEYLPYAIFLWLLPLLTMVISFGKNMRKSMLKQTVKNGVFH